MCHEYVADYTRAKEGHAVLSALTRVLKGSKDSEEQLPRCLTGLGPMIPGAAVRHQDRRMTGLRLSILEARPIL